MSDPLVDALVARCEGAVTADASLSTFTTLRVGGHARVLVEVESDQDLAAVGELAQQHGVRTMVVGRGSNLLVVDEGWPGIAIVLGRSFRGIEVDRGPDRGTVRVGAAEPMPALATAVADHGLGGLAWAAGVPGTVGGGVRMNAGAHGGDIASVLVEAELFRLTSRTREVWPAQLLGFGYRHSSMPADAIVVSATFALEAADEEQERAAIAEVRRWRREHQPINRPNCGSVFRNPPDDAAGRLIDSAGLRGFSCGGASVSEKHANFIVTTPGATASDVLTVLEHVRDVVREVHGVELVSELVVVGR